MAAMVHPVGVFAIFPFPAGRTIESMPDTIVHESGHVMTFQRFSLDPSSPAWIAWRKAMADDRLAPSTYASGFLEDAAESMLVFMASKNLEAAESKLGSDLGTLFPARRAILENELERAR